MAPRPRERACAFTACYAFRNGAWPPPSLKSTDQERGIRSMVEAVGHTIKLDEYLKDMIQAVYGACSLGVAHLKDSQPTVDKALEDCQEVLGTVMEGKVDEWVE